jgi:hypothetical protein
MQINFKLVLFELNLIKVGFITNDNTRNNQN